MSYEEFLRWTKACSDADRLVEVAKGITDASADFRYALNKVDEAYGLLESTIQDDIENLIA